MMPTQVGATRMGSVRSICICGMGIHKALTVRTQRRGLKSTQTWIIRIKYIRLPFSSKDTQTNIGMLGYHT